MDTGTWATIAALIAAAIAIIESNRRGLNVMRTDLGTTRTELSARIDHTQAQVAALDGKVDARADALDVRINTLDSKFDTRFDALGTQVYDLNTRVTAALGLPRSAEG